MKILVVDDEVKVAGFLQRGLQEEGHQVDLAYDGEAALKFAQASAYQLVILDVMLPGLDGLAVCQALRAADAELRILMLSARGETSDRVAGLRQGADDYMPKPFSFEELLARVEVMGRRLGHQRQHGELTLDLFTRTVSRGGAGLALTNREFDLLQYMMANADQVLSRERLAHDVWGTPFDTGTNVVDVYVTYLRKKLERLGARMIQTVRGEGYRFGSFE